MLFSTCTKSQDVMSNLVLKLIFSPNKHQSPASYQVSDYYLGFVSMVLGLNSAHENPSKILPACPNIILTNLTQLM